MKYRGSDGWLHDDTAGNRRYQNTENTQANKPKDKPKTDHKKCPNCTFSVSWRIMEQHCDRCGWGKPESNGEGALACCAFIGVALVVVLVSMGIGYGVGGFGGLIAGLGIGLSLPVGLIFLMSMSGSKKEA